VVLIVAEKLVFLHAYKTGGTWVREALAAAGVSCRDEGYQHWGLEASADVAPELPRFTVVRNPFTWYRSFWAFRCKGGWGGDLAPGHDCASPDFSEFLWLVTHRHPGFLTHLYRTYSGEEVQTIRMARLREDLPRLLIRRGVSFDQEQLASFPPVNLAGTLPEYVEQSLYTRRMAEAVVQSEQEVFDCYGYCTYPDPSMRVKWW
jgi:hypothetical protein